MMMRDGHEIGDEEKGFLLWLEAKPDCKDQPTD
jgi:hypothetical protein